MIRLALGLLILPAAFSAMLAAARTMGALAARPGGALWFVVGFFGYPAVMLVVFRPARLYVLGHELSHALAAWMSGAKVLSFSVREDGGHVDLSHSNVFVALAPYVVPIYALSVLAVWRVLSWRGPPSWRHAQEAFLCAFGAALAFHATHTAEALWAAEQPDLKQAGGKVFSWALIGLGNGLVLLAALKCLFPRRVAAGESLGMVWAFTRAFWRAVLTALETAVFMVWKP